MRREFVFFITSALFSAMSFCVVNVMLNMVPIELVKPVNATVIVNMLARVLHFSASSHITLVCQCSHL